MSKTKRYRVSAPYVTVLTSHRGQGGKPTLVGMYRDAMVPGDVPAQQIADLLGMKMIEEIEEPPAPSVAPPPEGSEGGREDDDPGDDPDSVLIVPKPPGRDEPKAKWVEHAVKVTASTPNPLTPEAADALKKDELVERFGPRAGG